MNAAKSKAGGDWEEQPGRKRSRAGRRRSQPRVNTPVRLLAIFAMPLMFMFLVVPTGFLVEGPGSSFDLQQDLEVSGTEQYSSRGELMLTSVRLEESILMYHVLSIFNHEFDLVKARDFLGEDLDVGERELRDDIITQVSENTASVVAMQKLGIPVELENNGVLVLSVLAGYPAEGKLEPGDVIVEIEGERVETVGRAGEILGSSPPGETLTLVVKTLNQEVFLEEHDEPPGDGSGQPEGLWTGEREVQLQPVWDPELDKAVVGVELRDFFTYSSEVGVSWELSASVKGPSAGLMMTLTLINALTPEDITGGKSVAGTGESFMDGSVGPIGGLPMKIRSAEDKGAEVFLYPLDNQDDLTGVSTTLELHPVSNLDEALEVLSPLEPGGQAPL